MLELHRLELLLERITPDSDDQPRLPATMPTWAQITAQHAGWHWLSTTYGLSELELDALLVAVAPEIDEQYLDLLRGPDEDERVCRPSVDVILRAIVAPAHRFWARAVFRNDATLLAERLVSLEPDPRLIEPVYTSQLVVIDDQIRDVLLHQGGIDRRLAPFSRLNRSTTADWSGVALGLQERTDLLDAVHAARGIRPLRVYLRGPRGSGRDATAMAVASELGQPLLTVDLASTSPETLRVAVREATVQGAILHLADADALAGESSSAAGRRALAGHHELILISGADPWISAGGDLPGVLEVDLSNLSLEARRASWESELERRGMDPDLAPELAARFHFGPGPIADAVATAVARAGSAQPTRDDLFAAARSRGSHHLAALARRIEPAYGWHNLVLPELATTQLREVCRRVTHGPTVWQAWGFDTTIAHGRGVTALFAGPSGTGKTMAAEVVARELGLDLFTVDLASVVSKYIGETEKNLERIFTAASAADAILMFDEADALFGKRSQVNDARDRYANIETAYLLQRMERYEGVAILATNLRTNLDEAFTRRLQFVVDFPFPDDAQRRRIWEVSFPVDAPRDPDLDLAGLARDIRLAGGNIRNVALHAAFLAAADDRVAPERRAIGNAHVRAAVRHELRKLGRVLPELLADPVDPADPVEPDRVDPDPVDLDLESLAALETAAAG